VILDGLGVGRTPEPGRIADRVAELMAQVAECARPVWTPRPANREEPLHAVDEQDEPVQPFARLVRGRR
ncbi:MAG: hypothetical protein WAW17_05890, partial [Rhodococcus sp. (in: high G+C Gram-positive bacteria)]